jgi:hypothetical protein
VSSRIDDDEDEIEDERADVASVEVASDVMVELGMISIERSTVPSAEPVCTGVTSQGTIDTRPRQTSQDSHGRRANKVAVGIARVRHDVGCCSVLECQQTAAVKPVGEQGRVQV